MNPILRPQFEVLRNHLIQIAGEEAQDDDQLWHDLADQESDQLDMLRRVVRTALTTETTVEALDARIRAMKERKARLQRQADACRSTVKECLGMLGLKKLQADDFTASMRTGQAPIVVPDAADLPRNYQRVTYEPRISEIRAALDRGDRVQGASFGNPAPILTVRTS